MEFEFCGALCAVPHCRKQDYLPFTCDGCQATFCLEHRTPAAHSCASAPAQAPVLLPCPDCGNIFAHLPAGAPASVKTAALRAHAKFCSRGRVRAPACPVPGCSARLVAPVRCNKCGVAHCVKHRLAEAHACTAAARAPGRVPRARSRRSAGGPAAPSGFANSPLSPVGDKRIDGALRVHFEVHFGASVGTGKKSLYFFANRKWLVGRTIDAVAKHVGLPTSVGGRRLQMRTSNGIVGMFDSIGKAVPQHSAVFVEYYDPEARVGSCAAEVSSEAVADKPTVVANKKSSCIIG